MQGLPSLVSVDDSEPFRIGQYQVTMAEYRLFLDDTGWRRPRHWPVAASERELKMPVSWVNHFDANAYCYWLSSYSGKAFFLPTVQMLRAAARSQEAVSRIEQEAKSAYDLIGYRPQGMQFVMMGYELNRLRREITSPYPWGEQADPSACNCQEFRSHRPGPTAIDAFEGRNISACGVVDLSGNLWEMTGSCKNPDGVEFSPKANFFDPGGRYPEFLHFTGSWPATLANVVGNLEKSRFGWHFPYDLLGGSYATPAEGCRTDRATAWTSAVNNGPYAGFRVANARG